ncbi:MAG: hypothetical protein AB7T14_09585 [Candidatus Methylacidiphilaceae bacterium]
MAEHLLSAASRLLGFSFVSLSLIQGFWKAGRARAVMEDVVGLAALLFLGCTVCAYLALRLRPKVSRWEKAADLFFLLGLFCTVGATVILVIYLT